jgi:hypothetical protein
MYFYGSLNVECIALLRKFAALCSVSRCTTFTGVGNVATIKTDTAFKDAAEAAEFKECACMRKKCSKAVILENHVNFDMQVSQATPTAQLYQPANSTLTAYY